MIVYQYNTAALYQGETEADESPLEPGVLLMPARTTTLPPPADVPEGRWPRWNGVTWELATKPSAPLQADPVTKLQAFLNENPDVAALIEQPAVAGIGNNA